MHRSFIALLVSLLASFGCRACSNCYDYASPVSPSQVGHPCGRAGSAFNNGAPGWALISADAAEEPIELTIPNAPQTAADPSTDEGTAASATYFE